MAASFEQRDLAFEALWKAGLEAWDDPHDLREVYASVFRNRPEGGEDGDHLPPVLAQTLSGFNRALVMQQVGYEVDVDLPLGFPGDEALAQRVRNLVEGATQASPISTVSFNPIRSGALRFLELSVVDNFGRARDVDKKKVQAAGAYEDLTDQDDGELIRLPPRMVRPTRVHFRWRDSDPEVDSETNAIPESDPIHGWVVLNHLEGTVVVFDSSGEALGVLGGGDRAFGPMETLFSTPSGLSDGLDFFLNAFFELDDKGRSGFIEDIIASAETIDGERDHAEEARAMLVSRPLAIVSATLDLQTWGPRPVHQGWIPLRQDMKRHPTRHTAGAGGVRWPVRIGAQSRHTDGVVGCWRVGDDATTGLSQRTFDVNPEDDAEQLTLLIDPRARVHLFTGVLPSKAIDIPRAHYEKAMDRLGVYFEVRPWLTSADELTSGASGGPTIQLPTPTIDGRTWSWTERDGRP